MGNIVKGLTSCLMNVALGITFLLLHLLCTSISVCYSPSPATIGITMPLDEKDRTANEDQAKNSVSVDSSRPVTTVQIRLADGSRLVGQFNHSHTIADIRRFIILYPLQEFSVNRAIILWRVRQVEILYWCLK